MHQRLREVVVGVVVWGGVREVGDPVGRVGIIPPVVEAATSLQWGAATRVTVPVAVRRPRVRVRVRGRVGGRFRGRVRVGGRVRVRVRVRV